MDADNHNEDTFCRDKSLSDNWGGRRSFLIKRLRESVSAPLASEKDSVFVFPLVALMPANME